MQPTLQQLSLAGTLFEDHFSVRTKDNGNVLFFTFCEGGKKPLNDLYKYCFKRLRTHKGKFRG
jgi:hypothetical protein